MLESLGKFEDISSFDITIIENNRRRILGGKPEFTLPHKFVANGAPKGYAANVNAAFSKISGDYFCTINPDVIFTQEIFKSLERDVRGGRGDIVAPIVQDRRGRLQDSARSLPTPGRLVWRRLVPWLQRPKWPSDLPEHPDWIAGVLLFMRSELFHALGGFDEGYFLYFDDVDFCTRARIAGYRLFLDREVQVVHDARRASRRHPRFLARHLSSAYRFFTSDAYRTARALQNPKA